MPHRALTFVTYCTPGRFEEMAADLVKSCEARGYRAIVVPIPQPGRGMNFYGHAMTKCLPVVDAALCDGPVALEQAGIGAVLLDEIARGLGDEFGGEKKEK